MQQPKRIIVLGAGFGGLAACKNLAKSGCEITLIDRQNHHLFQPLLYQVATAGLSAPEIAQPIRDILAKRKNIKIVMEEVESIDLDKKEVRTTGQHLPYDFLIIALGAVTGYFGNDGWEKHAPGLKTLEDATRIRHRVLGAFEKAEICDDAEERKRLMTIVVVGGGPTGVEMAGACAELTRKVLRDNFRNIDTADTRILLVEATAGILGSFDWSLSDYAREKLEQMGVDVRLGKPIEDLGADFVQIDGERIPCENIVWGAGVQASPITRSLGTELGPGGRIPVQPDLSLADRPEVFAIGDIVSLTDVAGVRVPGVAPAAMQMGKHAAKQINIEIEHGSPSREPFTYWDKGSMATIGRSAAVAEAGGFKMRGFIAWLAWLFVHLLLLVGLRNRLAVFINWVYSYVNYKRGARIITRLEND
ncbi:MAG: NADH dehydrogenase [Verrucomicrobiales bacterium]|jgi:NADH dehydrogenase